MCGIFGYAGVLAPDADLIEQAAMAAGRRGPHGHGWAQAAGDGTMTAVHRPGPVAASAGEIRRITGRLVVGHARLATFGDWRDTGQLQPVIAGRHAVAHNGNIYNAGSLGGPAPTDTIAFAAAYARARATTGPADALACLTAAAVQEAWAIVVADADGSLYAHRAYHPLFIHQAPEGTYLCSFPLAPSDQLLPEHQVTVISPEDLRDPDTQADPGRTGRLQPGAGAHRRPAGPA